MGTFRTQQLAPRIRRVWHDPSGQFDRRYDATLGDWGRSQVGSTPFEQHDDLTGAATLCGADGVAIAQPLIFERAADGSVTISFALSLGERIYGAYDVDAFGLDRRGEHVHFVSEIHPHRNHRLVTDCDLCTCGPTESAPDAIASEGMLVDELHVGSEQSSNYSELVIPFFVTSSGYGVYIANLTSFGVLDLGQRDDGRWTFSAPGGDADIYLFGPAPMPELVAEYTRLTGRQPLPPTWALGYIQSRFGYESFEHALDVLKRFERERLPVHGLVFDVQWLEQHVNLRWDPQNFSNPEENIARIAEYGPRVVVITEPGTRGDASNFASGEDIDAWARNLEDATLDSRQWYSKRGISGYREITPTLGVLVNFFSESVADWWYEQHVPLLEQGVDSWWLDLNEPEDVDTGVSFRNTDWPVAAKRLDGPEVRNLFALAQQRAFARRDRAMSDRRPFVLSRSGAAGSQRYGASPWSGDIACTWGDMREQAHLMLSAGICGIPLWGCDVGGFNGNPGPELFARWMQFGAFMPIFRAHGMMQDREPWSQGIEALEAVRPALLLRAQLLPSLATWAYEALRDGLPLVRPMLFDHEHDVRFADCSDQWMFGPLLAAPVLEEGATSRTVHLPAGGDWVDPWSGAVHEGGATIQVEAGLGTLPVFVPQATALIVDPDPLDRRGRNWPANELEVWTWAGDGASASTTLYVDDGITRMHEEGAYCYQRVSVSGDQLEAERLGGGWPTPRLRVATPHPGELRFSGALT